ncbi:hypothetical protein C2F74_RS05045 [Vibrio parahaemolyticus]|nr:hypothetical protein [Vibrio parahaemolyticus]
MYIYRALNEKEILTGVIRAKSLGAFLAPATPSLPVPFPVGETEFMAMYKHQYGESYTTSGISVTSSRKIAVEKYGHRFGVVVKFKVSDLLDSGMVILSLENELASHLIRYPEDEESIVVCDHIPLSLICEVISEKPNNEHYQQFIQHL